jgi:hypothetical protein
MNRSFGALAWMVIAGCGPVADHPEDAGSDDAASDAAAPNDDAQSQADAFTDGGESPNVTPVACGNTFCRVDESCVSAVCIPSAALSQQVTATVANNTFQRNGTGIYVLNQSLSVNYVNNIIVDNAIGVDLELANVTGSNNLLWGNTANYAHLAVDGSGYVKADPLFDGASPPRPKTGSPAHGAGDQSMLPATDFWGVPRTSVDIGAVQ